VIASSVSAGIHSFSSRARRVIPWLLLSFIILTATGVYFINACWPYRYKNVEPLLNKVFASQIKMDQYHRTYFPNPGFVATGLTLRRNSAPDVPPIGSASNLIVQGRWTDLLLFRNRVRLVEVGGLHIVLPAKGSRALREDFPPGSSADFSGPATVVEQLNIHDAVLDIMRTDGNRYSFPIHQLLIRNLQQGQTVGYTLDMQNAKPIGRIRSDGNFGPLIPNNLGDTPVSGAFTLSAADLADFHGISGEITTGGRFHGTLAAIEADFASRVPNFAVGKGRPTSIDATAHSTINGLNANIVLQNTELRIGKTTTRVHGSIVGSPKVTNLDIAVTDGRAQDLLRPFLRDDVPITGSVWLKSHAYVAPAEQGRKFLQRLRMDGYFDIPAQRLTNRPTAQKLSAFSERARNLEKPKDQRDILSSLRGRAQIRNGIVFTENLTFQIPGASVDLTGTFNLRGGDVHMLGDLHMQSDISHVTTGYKSMLLKPLIPFFRRDHVGAVVPIAITGSTHHYKVSQNILHHK
jgi:AsmA-like protein